MATTPGKRVTDGKKKHSHVAYDETPHFFGDEETLKSGGATADRHQPISAAASVAGEACSVDMSEIPGGYAATGRPSEGNRPPRGMKGKGPMKHSEPGAGIGRAGAGY